MLMHIFELIALCLDKEPNGGPRLFSKNGALIFTDHKDGGEWNASNHSKTLTAKPEPSFGADR